MLWPDGSGVEGKVSIAGRGGGEEGVTQPHRSHLGVGEEQEPREDAVGTLDTQQGVLFSGLQEDVLPLLQLEDHAARGDLEGILGVVTEGGHLLHVAPASDEVHAQVPSRAGVVGEVVEAGYHAGELATAGFIVVIHVGDHMVETDGLVLSQGYVDGPRGREGNFLRGLVVS